MARALLVLVLLTPGTSWAADRYVRPGATGNGSGTDWTNAYPSLPASLTRGDTYYLADGTYGSRTFNDPNNGTLMISIVKATVESHGTNVGWSDTYGDGQAMFTGWDVYTDYYTFNGQRRNSDWYRGTLSQYGIKVAGRGPVRLDNASGTGGDNLTFMYIDIQGGGRDTGAGDDVIYGLTGNTNVTFRYCAMHDSDRTIFLMRGNWRNLVVDHSYMARNTSTAAIHGELLSMTDSTNVTWSHNVMEDIEGTAFLAGLNNGTATDWKIYGNVAFHSPAYHADTGRKPGHTPGVTGFIYVANDSSNNNYGNNFLIYNNTFYNIKGLWSGVIIQRGSGNVVQNNVWYNSVRTGSSFSGTTGYNWYYNTQQDNDTSSTKVVCTASCDLFADSANKDFSLKMPTPAGLSLGSPYNVDPNNLVRGADGTWERGAYEYSNLPAKPTNLRITQ